MLLCENSENLKVFCGNDGSSNKNTQYHQYHKDRVTDTQQSENILKCKGNRYLAVRKYTQM